MNKTNTNQHRPLNRPLFDVAVMALRQLIESDGLDRAVRALAEASKLPVKPKPSMPDDLPSLIAAKINAGELRTPFSASLVVSKNWRVRHDRTAVDGALAMLVEAGVLVGPVKQRTMVRL